VELPPVDLERRIRGESQQRERAPRGQGLDPGERVRGVARRLEDEVHRLVRIGDVSDRRVARVDVPRAELFDQFDRRVRPVATVQAVRPFHAVQCGERQEAERAAAEDERRLGLPLERRPRGAHVFERLLDDAQRLDQEAVRGQVVWHRDQVLFRTAEVVGHEPVGAVDPPLQDRLGRGHLGLTAVEVVVRTAHGWPANGRGHDRPGGQVGAVSLDHDADRLVSEDEVILARREPPLGVCDDVTVGPVHADPERPDQRLAGGRLGSGLLDDRGGCLPGSDSYRVHTRAISPVYKTFILIRVNI